MGFLDILSAAAAFVGRIVEVILQIIKFLFALVIYVARFLFRALVQVFNFFLTGHQAQIGFDQASWIDGEPDILKRMLDKYDVIRDRLKKWFGPLYDYLKRVRDFWDKIFNNQLFNIIKMIQRIRRVLVVFRILHFRWAKRLDGFLFRMETRIAKVFIDIRGQINFLRNILNLILDPLGRFLPNVFLDSIARAAGAIYEVVHFDRLGFASEKTLAGIRETASIWTDLGVDFDAFICSIGTDAEPDWSSKLGQAVDREICRDVRALP